MLHLEGDAIGTQISEPNACAYPYHTCQLIAFVCMHVLTWKQLLFHYIRVTERYTITLHMKRMADLVVVS